MKNTRLIRFLRFGKARYKMVALGIHIPKDGNFKDIKKELQKCSKLNTNAIVIGFGKGFYDKLGLELPEGLTEMPIFPFDDETFEYRTADIVICIYGNELSELYKVKESLKTLKEWEVIFEEEGVLNEDKRNHLGFIDGISNLNRPEESQILKKRILTSEGGSMMVYRKIALDFERWEGFSIKEQERMIGLHKEDGAPIGDSATDMIPSFKYDQEGKRCPFNSHVRKSYPRRDLDTKTLESDSKFRILRRGYNFSKDKGLHFICYQKNIDQGFEYIYRNWICDTDFPHGGIGPDVLIENKIMRTVGGGYFYVPPNGALTGEDRIVDFLQDYV